MSPSRHALRNRGFSLIEVSIALSVAAVILALAGEILFSSTRSLDTVVADTNADQEMKKGIGRLLGELKSSASSTVAISTAAPEGDAVTFQIPGEFTGAVVWGARDAGGTWRQGWSARYLVLDGRLVRRTIDGAGNAVGNDELLVRQVDSIRDGLKGFRVVQNGPVIRAAVRVSKDLSGGSKFQREYSSAIHLKNA